MVGQFGPLPSLIYPLKSAFLAAASCVYPTVGISDLKNQSLATASTQQKQHSIGVERKTCLYANQHRVHCVRFHRKPLMLDRLKPAKSCECIWTQCTLHGVDLIKGSSSVPPWSSAVFVEQMWTWSLSFDFQIWYPNLWVHVSFTF